MRDDLPHAMRETARRLEPDVGRLTEGGVQRGTRMRRMERLAQVVGSAGAVAVVFAGVVLIGSHHGERTGTGSTPSNGPQTVPATGLSTPQLTDTPTPKISGIDLIGTLKTRLADAGVSGLSYTAEGTDRAQGVDPTTQVLNGPIFVNAQLSARHHVGFIEISFHGARDLVVPAGTNHSLGGNMVAYIDKGSFSLAGHPGGVSLMVTLVRPDGSSLSATEINSADDKTPAESGAPLLLGESQVVTLLDSTAWDAAIAAAAADAAPTRGHPTAFPPSTIVTSNTDSSG